MKHNYSNNRQSWKMHQRSLTVLGKNAGDFQVKMVILFQKLFIIFTTEMFLHAHFRTVRERKENTDERTVQIYHNTDRQSEKKTPIKK